MTVKADAFSTLGVEPTLDRKLVKRAYFATLREHPPHEDPAGFRRIRDAYESLAGDGLMAAWASAGVDVARSFASIDAQLRPRIELALGQLDAIEGHRWALAGFETLLTLELAAASDALANPGP